MSIMGDKLKEKIVIVGSGLIGKSWAMLFVGAGYEVKLYDVIKKQVEDALVDIYQRLDALEKVGMLRGKRNAAEQFQLISGSDDLKDCLRDAIYVQECIPESLDLKIKIFKELDENTDSKTILASSSSAMPSSKFTENLEHRERCLIAHPVNPPYYMPMVELVPAPWTSPEVVERTRKLMAELGQSPVTIKKEIAGFVQPRIQYAMIMECMKLVEDGVLDVDDIDKVIKDGIGTIFAFLGPFEMLHLNYEGGIREFLKSEEEVSYQVQSSLNIPSSMNSKSSLVEDINKQLELLVPTESLTERRKWRDVRLAALAKLRNDFKDV